MTNGLSLEGKKTKCQNSGLFRLNNAARRVLLGKYKELEASREAWDANSLIFSP